MPCRHTSKAQLVQERFSSAQELRGDYLLANLVAKRCALIDDGRLRRLIWWIQDVSMRQGLERHPACNQFPAHLNPVETERSGLEMLAVEILTRGGRSSDADVVRDLKLWLARICLDPDDLVLRQRPVPDLDALHLAEIIMGETSILPLGRLAETQTRRAIFDVLDFALESRGFVLAEGTYRVGKSFCAQAWAMSHLGEARYVQLTSVRDDESFYRTIAKAVGCTAALTRSGSDIRERIEMTLQGQQLMLVIDEAAYLLPQATRTRYMPNRLCWILTALVNRGVAVALIASRDFSRMMAHMKRTLPIFGQEQFWGRLRLRIDLPDALDEGDLVAISRVLAPEADDATLLLLAGMALLHTGYISTVESVVARARFLARKTGKPFRFAHAMTAMSEIDPSFRPEKFAPRGGSAASPRTSRGSDAGARSFEPGRRFHGDMSGTTP